METKDLAQHLLPLLEDLFEDAGEIALEHFRSSSLSVETKVDASPVTVADKELNSFFIERLEGVLEGSSVIGEESSSRQDTQNQGPQYYWILDPLDGTKEFISGSNEWSMLLSLYESKLGNLLSVVYQPTEKLFYWALPSMGAHVKNLSSGAVQKLNASRKSEPQSAFVSLSKSRRDPWVDRLSQRHTFAGSKGRGSIGLKAVDIASGASDLYLNSEGRCGAWDVLPCLLFLEESGAATWFEKDLDWRFLVDDPHVKSAFAFGAQPLISKLEKDLQDCL